MTSQPLDGQASETEITALGELSEKIDIKIEFTKVVNYAAAQNNVPLINRLLIQNNSELTFYNVEVKVCCCPDFFSEKRFVLDTVGPGESVTFSAAQLQLQLNHDYLFNLDESEKGHIEVAVNTDGHRELKNHSDLRVLARKEWGATLGLPELLAAHVQPNSLEIDRILSAASQLLKQSDGALSLNGYQSKNRQQVWKQANAIYQTLLNMGLHYAPPPASFESTGQKIRTTEQILDAKIVTCLDSSVLLAACLEQAGLNPVILFKKGHAWVGLWLIDSRFPNPTEDCAQDVRKRIASGELITLESTGLSQGVPMRKAIADAKPYLEDEQAVLFEYAIDIKRARENHIKAMRTASTVAVGGQTELELSSSGPVLEMVPELPPLDTASISGEEIFTDNTPQGRLTKWRSKLLDLTLRNRLLNFKPSAKFLKIVTHDIAALEDALLPGTEFRLVPKRSLTDSGDPRSEESFLNEYGLSSAQHHAKTVLSNREVCFDVEQSKLQDQATVIFREAKNVLDETGSNSLYLALGILSWKETPEAETVLKAPILLVPIKLKRGAVGAGLRLERLDEETIFNPTLIQKLALTFEINLPYTDGTLPTDASGVDVAGIFALLRKKIAEMKGFEVLEECYLGNYSFTKYVMWKDLSQNAADLIKNQVVNHLVNHQGEAFRDNTEAILPADLDRLYKPQTLHTPLLADSSQLAVICTAEKGRNMVVEGPPGTGKSQTITNLISHFLSNGKTVLFVAEKMAALEVVHKRLTEIGLSDFLLELHSTKAKKSEISRQFVQVLDSASNSIIEEWDREAERLASLKGELNTLVQTLHKRHSNGLTVYEAMGLTLSKELEPASFQWADSDIHDYKQTAALEDFVGELAALASRLSRISGHPLLEIKQKSWSPSWEEAFFNAAQTCTGFANDIEARIGEFSTLVFLEPSGVSLAQLENIDSLAHSLVQASALPVESIDKTFAAQDRKKLADLIQHGKARATLWDEFKGYDSELKTLDANTLKHQWRAAKQDWWPKKWLSKRNVSNQIRLFKNDKIRVADEKMEDFLELLKQLNTEDQYLSDNSSIGTSCLGSEFKAENTDWEKAALYLNWMENLARSTQRTFDAQVEQIEAARAALKRMLTDQNESFSPGERIFNIAQSYRDAYASFILAFTKLKELSTNSEFLGGINQTGLIGLLRASQAQWLSNRIQIQPWCVWNDYRQKAFSTGLGGLVDQVEKNVIQLEALKPHFKFSYANWWLRKVLDKEHLLANFSGASHAHKIEEFQKADQRFQQLTIQYVQAKLKGKIPSAEEQTKNLSNEVGFLRREAQKQKMHRPIREVIQKTRDLLPLLKPCLLMSPQSVAQYLDTSSQLFDVVIFDEASQIPTWDAIGAIARGKQLICVGDPKQLPPTNFFNSTDAAGNADEENLVEMESVLDECLSVGLPLSRLSWHYRSRNEGLIAFSNCQYYESNLVTFPGPVAIDNSVEFIDSKGVYEPGKSRTNKIEAAKIVDEIENHYLSGMGNKFSIGVITFNSSQQTLIEKLLDAKRLANKQLDIAIADASTEELFIKNLENVQGDERDMILFSITFGKDAAGKLSMNFGPMNKEGGHRRLNVAATRARHKVKVYSSLRPEDIDLSRTNARGVADLKTYLDFALNGTRALIAQSIPTGREPDSPFELQVIQVLREHGWQVVPQVGVSGYRIDMAVVNRHEPGKFLLGIECDGATYHSAPSARDRDRLRQMILEGLGWNIHRIWSTDWWFNRDIPLKALLDRLAELDREAQKLMIKRKIT